jgi:transcriptional regulator with XRE-family HTH domain
MIDLHDIAEAIVTHRKEQRLTQHQLAAQARVSRDLIAKLETGRLPELGVKKLLRILRAVGLDLRMTTLNLNRPTLEDLQAEEAEADRKQ